MPIITQYRPAFISGFKNETKSFFSSKDLFDIQWVDNFKNDNNFYQFSISKSNGDYYLMAEYDKGNKWYVVGELDDDENISVIEVLKDIPKFKK